MATNSKGTPRTDTNTAKAPAPGRRPRPSSSKSIDKKKPDETKVAEGPVVYDISPALLLSMLSQTHQRMSAGEEVVPVAAGVFEQMIHELIIAKCDPNALKLNK